MRTFLGLLAILWSAESVAHPGGGIIALSEDAAIVADSVENFVWKLEKGKEAKRLVSKFHGHWMTRGLDGHLYAEALQESGGAWSSAAFRLDLQSGKLTEVAHRSELGALVFAVDRDGSLVFERGGSLMSRKDGKETLFRSVAGGSKWEETTAYAWSREGDLILAARNRIHQIAPQGETKVIAEIHGKVLEPKIWNGTDVPSVFSLALDQTGRVVAAVPALAKVYRIEKGRPPDELVRSEEGWRATGVSIFGDSVFLMESDSRASTSPRVRVLRANGTVELLPGPFRQK